jgi:HTH-type transcriptional regulator, cell division transcriptional repressor
MDEDSVVGKRVRVARILSGVATARDFAKRTGCHHVTLSNIERGRMRLSPDMAKAFASVAGVAPEWLLTGEGEGPDITGNTTSPEAA